MLVSLSVLLAVTACSWPQEVRGNLPDADAVKQIEVGKTNKADVERLIGSPSSTSEYAPNTWYYISRRQQRDTLSDPILMEQKVYVVTFDDKGVVKEFKLHENDTHDVSMIARATPAPGRELSFIEQLLGNFGKFTGKDKKKKNDD